MYYNSKLNMLLKCTVARLLLFIPLIITFSQACERNHDPINALKVLSSISEDLEMYRNWTRSKMENLDVKDEFGRVDPDAVTKVLNFNLTALSCEDIKQTFNCSNAQTKQFAYYGLTKDLSLDYFYSEALIEMLDSLYTECSKHAIRGEVLSKPILDSIHKYKLNLLDIATSCATSIRMASNSNPWLKDLWLRHGHGKTIEEGARSFVDLELTEEVGYDMDGTLFTCKLMSAIINKIDAGFGNRELSIDEIYIITHCPETLLTGYNQIVRDIVGLLNRDSFINPQKRKLALTLLQKYLFEGKFDKHAHKKKIDVVVNDFVNSNFLTNDMKEAKAVYDKNNTKTMVNNTHTNSLTKPRARNNNKRNKKISNNYKDVNPTKANVTPSKHELGKVKEVIEVTYAETRLEEVAVKIIPPIVQLTKMDDVIPPELELKENNLNITTEITSESENFNKEEYDFKKWYQTEVLDRIKFTMCTNSTGVEQQNSSNIDRVVKISLSDKGQNFYNAVMISSSVKNRPVVKSDFDTFLNDVKGRYGLEKLSGSRVYYYLPNHSKTRDRNPYLRFMTHLPHNGSAPFPNKTLKFFIKNAFETCEIYKGVDIK